MLRSTCCSGFWAEFWFRACSQLFSIGAANLLVVSYSFLVRLEDGSINSFNMAIWLPLVCVPSAVLWGGLRLKVAVRLGVAKTLLGLLAIPGLLLGSWMLLVLFSTHSGAYR